MSHLALISSASRKITPKSSFKHFVIHYPSKFFFWTYISERIPTYLTIKCKLNKNPIENKATNISVTATPWRSAKAMLVAIGL